VIENIGENMNELVEYVRKNVKGQRCKVGVLYASVTGSLVCIGWSKTNMKAGDKFDPKKGIELAKNRSKVTSLKFLPPLPTSMKTPMKKFENRCMKYFKKSFLNLTFA
jgi:hypothetical protein